MRKWPPICQLESQMFFSCNITANHKYSHARTTTVTTAHGTFNTPAFMPVGTRAGVNCMDANQLGEIGSEIILGGNTYHMLVAPGMDVIKDAGGMHPFMAWQGPMLTDSGGFQVFSLSKNSEICTIDEEGAHFKHPETGKVINMSPEISLQTQKIIGADIIMAFDQCTPDIDDKAQVIKIMERTHRWLEQSIEYQAKYPNSVYGYSQALFGIVQGGIFPELRRQCAEYVASLPLDGIAIGGETIGFDMAKTVEVVDWVRDLLPAHKTRYTMGVGLSPQDLCDVVASGIDIFDCVAPTRNARHGALYSGQFVVENNWLAFKSEFPKQRLQIKRAEFAQDEQPLMQDCDCYTCKNYTRAALHYLYKQKSVLFANLASIHNVYVMHEACRQMRQLISNHSD